MKIVTWSEITAGTGGLIDRMERGEVRSVTLRARPIATIRRCQRGEIVSGWDVTTRDLQREPLKFRTRLEEGALVFRRFGTAEAVIEGVKP